METALAQLAEFAGDPEIAKRDPRSPLSFSRVSPEIQRTRSEELKRFRTGEKLAFSPLGHDGRPVRKFSERYNDHWSQADSRDGVSCAVGVLPDMDRKSRAMETDMSLADTVLDRLPSAETVSTALVRKGRGRRPTFGKPVSEKTANGALSPSLIPSYTISAVSRLVL